MKNDGSNIVPFKPGGPVDPTAPLPAISPKRQARIWKTHDLFLGGMKVTELATYFGISRKQVYKDLADAGRLTQALVRDFDSEGTLGREIRLLEELRRKAMRNFSTARQEGVKQSLRMYEHILSIVTPPFQHLVDGEALRTRSHLTNGSNI
jgi:hypothetical protein